MNKQNWDELEKRAEKMLADREKKQKKMKVSGGNVRKLAQIIKNKKRRINFAKRKI